MDDNLTAVLIVVPAILGVIYLRYLKFKVRSGDRLNAQDNASLEHMTQVAQRLEQRVATLERILDAETPGWRRNTNPEVHYGSSMG